LTLTETQTRNQALEHFSIEITRCWIFFFFSVFVRLLFRLWFYFCWTHIFHT